MESISINMEKVKKGLIIVGVLLLVFAIVASVDIAVACNKVGEKYSFTGDAFSVGELKRALDGVKLTAETMDMSIAEMIGVSGFRVFMLRASLGLQVWLFVLGGLSLVCGILLSLFGGKIEKPGDVPIGIDIGVIGDVMNNMVIKCPVCGKISKGKARYCGQCATELPKKVPVEKPPKKVICKHCGETNAATAKYCNRCGKELEKVEIPIPEKPAEPVKLRCRVCFAENDPGAIYCNNCASKLRVDRDLDIPPRGVLPDEDKEDKEPPIPEDIPPMIPTIGSKPTDRPKTGSGKTPPHMKKPTGF